MQTNTQTAIQHASKQMSYLYTVFVMMEVNKYICKSNSCETQQVFIHVYIAKIPYIYYSHIYTCKI